MKTCLHWALASLLFHAAHIQADALQNHDAIRHAVENFAREQTLTLPGSVTVKAGGIDPRLRLKACPSMEAFIPVGGKLFGSSTVGVRCTDPVKWTLFVPVQVRVSAAVLVAARSLQNGQTVQAEDISTQYGDLAVATILTDPAEAVGKVLKFSVAAGQPFRRDMLRAPFAIAQGQTVKIRVEGDGFAVQSAGQALNNAAQDQNVQVKTQFGQVISGIARAEGIVSLNP